MSYELEVCRFKKSRFVYYLVVISTDEAMSKGATESIEIKNGYLNIYEHINIYRRLLLDEFGEIEISTVNYDEVNKVERN